MVLLIDLTPVLQMILVLIIFSGCIVVDVVFIVGFAMGRRGGYTITGIHILMYFNLVTCVMTLKDMKCAAITPAG